MQDAVSWSSSRFFSVPTANHGLTPRSTLFCDFDGPIADVSDRYYSTYCLALAAIQAQYAERQIVLPIRRLTRAQFWFMKQNRFPDHVIADWSGLTGEQVSDFLGHVAAIVNQSDLLHKDQLQPGAAMALRELKNRHVRIVIVTLRQAAQVLDFLQKHDLATLISQIYGAESTAQAYPNRTEHKVAQLKEAIADQNRLGFDTAHSWMVGDTEADVQAGHAAGLPTIALTCGIRSCLYLKDFTPTAIYRDLATATAVLMSPSQVAHSS